MTKSVENSERTSGHILIVEDDVIVQLVVKKILEQAGYTSNGVGDGLEAITALESQNFDLVLMDCLIPGMDGFDTTRMIRKAVPDRFNPAIPVIAMTGLTEPDDRIGCLEAGMDAVVNKPVDPQTLIAEIRRHLSRPENAEPKHKHDYSGADGVWSDEFLDCVIDEFLAEAPVVIEDLQQAVKQGDLVKLQTISHRFRGAADILKASELSARSRALEHSAKNRDMQLADRLAQELIEELQKLTSMLSE